MDTTTKKKKHVSGVTVVSYIVLALLSLSAILLCADVHFVHFQRGIYYPERLFFHSFGVQPGRL